MLGQDWKIVLLQKWFHTLNLQKYKIPIHALIVDNLYYSSCGWSQIEIFSRKNSIVRTITHSPKKKGLWLYGHNLTIYAKVICCDIVIRHKKYQLMACSLCMIAKCFHFCCSVSIISLSPSPSYLSSFFGTLSFITITPFISSLNKSLPSSLALSAGECDR